MSTTPCILIAASAGSGKTYQLTRHYLKLLRQGVAAGAPDVAERILATTFTRAAAREITSRILQALAQAVLDPVQRRELDEATRGEKSERLPPLTVELCGQMLATLVGRLHRLRIGTLDAFLVRSALAFAPEIGLPPAWQIADAAADQTLRVEAIEKVLHDHVGPGAGRDTGSEEGLQALLDLLVLLNQGAYPRTVLASLGESFAATYETFLGSGPESWNQPTCEAVALAPRALAALLMPLRDQLYPLAPTTGKGKPNANWIKAIDKLAAAAGAKQWNVLAEMTLFANSNSLDGTYCGKPIPEEFRALLSPFYDHLRATLTRQLRHSNLALRGLLTAFDRTYREGKFRGGSYRFEDFARLLDESEVRAGSATFYYRLDGQIDHLLLDEFQDTSVAQWRFLEPLALEIAAGSTGALQRTRSFFCVGDVKQSLYGWRNAERGLFSALPEILHEVQHQTLAQSRRSTPKVIETVNAVFANLPGNRLIQTHASDEEGGREHLVRAAAEWARDFAVHTAYKQEPPGHCVLRTCPLGEKAEDHHALANALAAQRVAALLEANPQQEIAVLFRNGKGMAGLLEQLRQRHIRATGEGGSPLTDDPAVCCALSLLHLVDHPSDTAAAFHVATSPLGAALGLPDDAPAQLVVELTQQIRRELLDRGLPAVLNTWRQLIAAPADSYQNRARKEAVGAPALVGGPLSAGRPPLPNGRGSDLCPGADDRNLLRFGQLVDLAHAYEGDPLDLASFTQLVQETKVEDRTPAAVKVMTIHASKGREFDSVILPDLDGKFCGHPPALLTHRPTVTAPFDQVTQMPGPALRLVDPDLEELHTARRQREVVEELCALYVGMTRAKTTLEMIVWPQAANQSGECNLPASMAGILRGALCPERTEVAAETILWEIGTPVEQSHQNRDRKGAVSAPMLFEGGMPESRPPLPDGRGSDGSLPDGRGSDERATNEPWLVRLAPALPAQVAPPRLRQVVSPSSMEGGGKINLANRLALGTSMALDRGTAFHRLFEQVGWLEDGLPPEQTLRAALADLGLSREPLTRLLGEFQAACAQPAVRAALSRGHSLELGKQYAGLSTANLAAVELELWRERRFAVPLGEAGRIVAGQLDRVVLVRQGGKLCLAIVQDYKTDQICLRGGGGKVDQEVLAGRVAHYRPQLEAYCGAIAALTGLNKKRVVGELIFVGADVVVAAGS